MPRRKKIDPYAAHVVGSYPNALCAACGERLNVTTDVYICLVGACATGCTEQEQIEAHRDFLEREAAVMGAA